MRNSSPGYFKGRYLIAFYDETDEICVGVFKNIWEICVHKKLDTTQQNYALIKMDLYNAFKREGNVTKMLDGRLMHVYLIDNEDE